jgi:hypothetical protein
MNDAPRVGPPSDEHRAICLYSLAPGQPRCTAAATIHVLVNDPGYGTVALPACDEHVHVARVAGSYLLEHAFEGWCGFPATRWLPEPANRCELDDSGPHRTFSTAGEGHRKATHI